MNQQIQFEDVSAGDGIPTVQKKPTSVQLFRFSAVTGNAHRIHYDKDYAVTEGHPDVLVQAHLHGAFLAQMVVDWMGPRGRLRSFAWQNRARAVPSDILTCRATVVRKDRKGPLALVELELVEHNQRNEICASGSAVVALPVRSAQPNAMPG
jgi:hydroxyacyl-ACP dehydratase HTD2-like protein with hotdog domain